MGVKKKTSLPFGCCNFGKASRRDFLYGLSATLGTAAFNTILQAQTPEVESASSLAVKPGHHPAKAKACIFLFMEGGPSHIDTFDPKPRLRDLHMEEFVREDRFVSAMASGKRYYIESPFQFRKAGTAGIDMCEHFEELAKVADELCIYRGCQGESINHPTACYHLNTGNRFGGDPAMGAWVTYGLGTLNQNLPAFVVLPEVAYPQGGAANWSNGFLEAHYQGTPLRPEGAPILDLEPPYGVTRDVQRQNLELLGALNRQDAQRNPQQEELAARMETYELAIVCRLKFRTLSVSMARTRRHCRCMGSVARKRTPSVGAVCWPASW